MTRYRVTIINRQGAQDGTYCDTSADAVDYINSWSELADLSISVTSCQERDAQMLEREIGRSPIGDDASALIAALKKDAR